MRESRKLTLPNDRDRLLAKIESPDKQIYRKQLDMDILDKAVDKQKRTGRRSTKTGEQGEGRPDRCPENEVPVE